MSFRRAARAAFAAGSRAYWLVVITLILAGISTSCGNSSHASSASHAGYVTLLQKNAVAVLRLNDSTGVVSLGAQTPSVVGATPDALALAPSKKFLYVGNSGPSGNSISIFTISGDGTVTQQGQPTHIGATPPPPPIDPSANYLVSPTHLLATN